MPKYIDIEKLKVLLSDLKENHKQYRGDFDDGVVFAVDEILDDIEENIDSLQAEQSSLPDNLDEAAEEYENTLWEDGCKDCGYSPLEVFYAFKAGAEWMAEKAKQEQPEVDLEEEVRNYMEIHHLHIKDGGRVVFDNGDSPNFMCDIRDIARHFFERGMSVMRERITNPDYNQKDIEKIKSEYPMDESNARKEE